MADITLTATPPIPAADVVFGTSTIRCHSDLVIVSVATPLGGDAALADALSAGFGLQLPEPAMTTAAGGVRAVRTAPDQMLLVFAHSTPDAESLVRGRLNGTGYTTDQTDAWVMLDLKGPDARRALERLCPIDLHDSAFPIGSSARTVMAHMGALIVRVGPENYRLMSASSSARSFLQAVETSCRNAL